MITEAGSKEGTALLADLASGTVSLSALEHLIGELVNGLRKCVGQQVLRAADA